VQRVVDDLGEVPSRMAISVVEIAESELSRISRISRERESKAAKPFLRIVRTNDFSAIFPFYSKHEPNGKP